VEDAASKPIWQQPAIGGYPDPALIGLSGLERMRAFREGRGRSLAISNCRVENADGKPVALAAGSSMYLPGRPANLAGIEQLGAASPDPKDESGA
jgi:hypothetical protein